MKLAAVFFFALSLNASAGIIKETWTCKQPGGTILTAVVTPEGAIGMVAETEASLSFDANRNGIVELIGTHEGRDFYSYRAMLIRSRNEDFSDSGPLKTKVNGRVVLISDMDIDCLGQAATADTYPCEVVIERE